MPRLKSEMSALRCQGNPGSQRNPLRSTASRLLDRRAFCCGRQRGTYDHEIGRK